MAARKRPAARTATVASPNELSGPKKKGKKDTDEAGSGKEKANSTLVRRAAKVDQTYDMDSCSREAELHAKLQLAQQQTLLAQQRLDFAQKEAALEKELLRERMEKEILKEQCLRQVAEAQKKAAESQRETADKLVDIHMGLLRNFSDIVRDYQIRPPGTRPPGTPSLCAAPSTPRCDQLSWPHGFSENTFLDAFRDRKFKHICVVTGAGISVAAGIPDYRSPGTGLYDSLKKAFRFSELRACPERLFDIDFFIKSPETFYKWAREYLNVESLEPTFVHKFCKLLIDKHVVMHYLTQNVDSLELKAGIPEEKVVQAHGSMRTAHCAKCSKAVEIDDFHESYSKGEVLRCTSCNGPVKPGIVFLGDDPSETFRKVLNGDLSRCDLMLIIGTSLAVSPFNEIVDKVKCPQVLINKENTRKSGFDFDDRAHPLRLWMKGDCQEIVERICKHCGWSAELR